MGPDRGDEPAGGGVAVPMNAVALAKLEREKSEQRARVREAVELRGQGKSFREIAQIQGCSVHTATKRYHKGVRQYLPEELVESVRSTELDRFDILTQINFGLLAVAYKAGDVDAVCKLEDKILAVHDRRKKLVPVEVPVRIQLDQTVTSQDSELMDLLSGMSAEVNETIGWLQENATP